MTAVAIAGWSALTARGAGPRELRTPVPAATAAAAAQALYDDPLPAAGAAAIDGFDIRAELGRKGTSSFDRVTGLAVVCCRGTLEASGVDLGGERRDRVGVALGTTVGSQKSTSDYTLETLVQEKPYLVNPMLFPNTVMNCAAGQVAIRFGLRGVNATIAGGPLAFLNSVRYAVNLIGRGYADVMLTGAAEEFSPHRAWTSHLTGATREVACGEAAAMFALRRAGEDDHEPTILAVATAYGPGGGEAAEDALSGCVRRVLARGGRTGDDVTVVVTGEPTERARHEFGPAVRALGCKPRRVLPKTTFGECDAAAGAVALAALLAEGVPGIGLLTGRGPDGAVGAALVRIGGR
jgi:3-oxoacyl-[acyl-carrier-protein] synthase II